MEPIPGAGTIKHSGKGDAVIENLCHALDDFYGQVQNCVNMARQSPAGSIMPNGATCGPGWGSGRRHVLDELQAAGHNVEMDNALSGWAGSLCSNTSS